MDDRKEGTPDLFKWRYFNAGIFISPVSVFLLKGRGEIDATLFVKNYSLLVMALMLLTMVFARALKIIDIKSEEYKRNPPLFIRVLFGFAIFIVGHCLGFALLNFIFHMMVLKPK